MAAWPGFCASCSPPRPPRSRLPALAHAEERTLTFTTPAISVEGYGVAQQPMLAESPKVDGYVVGMEAEVVDAQGRVQGRDKVMLHHIVFAKVGVPDYTCGGAAERFFAEGEERLALSLPRGYGYANKATDRWGLLYMLMNHKPQRLNGFIRYTVRYVTGEALTPVKPVWLDVRNCTGPDPVFDVPGGGRRFSTFTKTAGFTMPESGRLVSGGGHLHGGGVRLELRNSTCGTKPFESRPTWGGPKPKPLLHEPGPTKMSAFRTTAGIPVAKGDRLAAGRGLRQLGAAHAGDGDHAALPRAGSRQRLRRDAGARHRPRPSLRPAGVLDAAAARAEGHGLDARSRPGSATSATAPSGSCSSAARRFTWRFRGSVQHDVTVVGGPVGFSAPWTQTGTFKHRFTKAGTYRLFCSLHPAKMVQQITVR